MVNLKSPRASRETFSSALGWTLCASPFFLPLCVLLLRRERRRNIHSCGAPTDLFYANAPQKRIGE